MLVHLKPRSLWGRLKQRAYRAYVLPYDSSFLWLWDSITQNSNVKDSKSDDEKESLVSTNDAPKMGTDNKTEYQTMNK